VDEIQNPPGGSEAARGSGHGKVSERRIVVVTGLSGAGKSTALKAFEDAGYYCIDNLPPKVIPDVLETASQPHGEAERLGDVVVAMDIRGLRYFGKEIRDSLKVVEGEPGWNPRVIFVEADDSTLVRRYKESRRPHPAARDGDMLSAIQQERGDLADLRDRADIVVDTSGLSAAELRLRFGALAGSESFLGRLTVSVISFGFKHGVPLDVDMLLDVRFLPNPHYDPELRPLTGHDAPVREAVLGSEDCEEFLERSRGLVEFLIPRYTAEGKSYFTIGIGCTGGRHRSVTIAGELARRLGEAPEVNPFVRHRDLERPI
jgi:UPF0042 nucleotide-binding protein